MKRRHLISMAGIVILATFLTWFLGAYEFAPRAWRFVERRHPALAEAGVRTTTASGIPGDIVNFAFVGSQDDLVRLLSTARWSPADPITIRSALRIAVDSVRHESYVTAPVSPLYLFGRIEDLAFERQDGRDPTRRHHVRFWRAQSIDGLTRPMWLGAATYDYSVGIARTTGQITHHTADHVDRERNTLLDDLTRSTPLEVTWIDGYQAELIGHNGGGDRYETDGRLVVVSAPP